MSLTLLLLSFAAAPDASPTPPATAKPALICRKSERETGSHIRTSRMCKTAAEWSLYDARRAAAPATLRVTEGQDAGKQTSH